MAQSVYALPSMYCCIEDLLGSVLLMKILKVKPRPLSWAGSWVLVPSASGWNFGCQVLPKYQIVPHSNLITNVSHMNPIYGFCHLLLCETLRIINYWVKTPNFWTTNRYFEMFYVCISINP